MVRLMVHEVQRGEELGLIDDYGVFVMREREEKKICRFNWEQRVIGEFGGEEGQIG